MKNLESIFKFHIAALIENSYLEDIYNKQKNFIQRYLKSAN